MPQLFATPRRLEQYRILGKSLHYKLTFMGTIVSWNDHQNVADMVIKTASIPLKTPPYQPSQARADIVKTSCIMFAQTRLLVYTLVCSLILSKYCMRHKNGDISVPSRHNIICSEPFTAPFPFCVYKRPINTLGVSYRRITWLVCHRLESMLWHCHGIPNFAGTLCCCHFSTLSVFCEHAPLD